MAMGTIFKRGNRYWIQFFDHGKRFRESAKTERKGVAERLLVKRLAEVQAGTFGGTAKTQTTVADLLDDLLSDYRRNEKSIDWAEILDRHLRPSFGPIKANRITTQHLQRYIEQRLAAGRAAKTVNLELGFLRRAFNLGADATPPRCKPLPKLPALKVAPPRSGFFEHDEYLRMLDALPGYLKPVVCFAYFTGCRRGEILALRWNQIDLDAKLVRLNAGETKSGEGRVIPIGGELLEVLRAQKAERDELWPDCGYVFYRRGRQIKAMNDAWRIAARKAGLWDSEAGRVTRLFHDLRRTGVRNLVRSGVAEVVAMKISGHRTRSIFDRYNIVSERDLHDAAAALNSHISKLAKRDSHKIATAPKAAKKTAKAVRAAKR
jgi:integrase